MHLKNASAFVVQKFGQLPDRLPDRPILARTAAKLEDLPATETKLDMVDHDKEAAEIAAILRAGDALNQRQVRLAPWCLWDTKPALAHDTSILPRLLKSIEESANARPFRALASSWLTQFRQDLPAGDEIAACLRRLAAKWDNRLSEAHRRFAIFHEVDGPEKLAVEVRRQGRPVTQILQTLGLGAIAANGRYAQAITMALLMQLASGSEPDHLRRLDLVEKHAFNDGKILFDGLRPFVAAAVLQPCLQGAGIAEDVKRQLLQFILAAFRDLRLSPGTWVNIDPDIKDLVVGWLSRESLRQFLDIVDDTAKKYMWRYRRAFWEAVYSFYEDLRVPVEAWVALGDKGARRARTSFGSAASFGRLTQSGKPVQPGHAVLLLKIGDVFIADWSHEGKCNLWLDSRLEDCPKLYQLSYGSDEVDFHTGTGNWETTDRASLIHVGSENYRWQDKIADKLAGRLRHRIPRSRYLVR